MFSWFFLVVQLAPNLYPYILRCVSLCVCVEQSRIAGTFLLGCYFLMDENLILCIGARLVSSHVLSSLFCNDLSPF